MDCVALIPARGGSKSIPRKNIAELAGRPMLAYTADAALSCGRLRRTILSTDDDEIARVGRECGIETPFVRPPELARDDTSSVDVALHALEWLRSDEGRVPDVLVLLQPTSPLRRSEHISAALDEMERLNADTVVSVVEIPHRSSPYAVMRRAENGLLRDFWTAPLPFDRFRRQGQPKFYARNGPAVLAVRSEILLEHHSFYGSRVAPLIMNERDSIDIDGPFDLELAEYFLGRAH